MMSNNKYQITPIEMSISLISLLFGVGILTLPRALAEVMGTPDGWISVLIGGVISGLLIYLYTRLQRHFPNQTLLEYISLGKMGKWAAKGMALLFIFYFISVVSLQLRALSVAVNLYLIKETPSEVLVMTCLLVTIYAVSKGIQGIVHIHLLFTPFILTALIVLLVFNLGNAQFDRLLPIASEGFSPILSGIAPSMFSFVGIHILFFFMTFMKDHDLKAFPLNFSLMIVVLVYVSLVMVTYATLGLEMTRVTRFPAIEIAKEIEFIGGFIERLESIFLTIYIMAIFTSMMNLLLQCFQAIHEQLLQKESKTTWLSALLCFIIVIVAFIPNSPADMDLFVIYVTNYGIFLVALVMMSGFITVWLRNRKKRSEQQASL